MTDYAQCTELVVVCCHAIYNTNAHDPFEESNWHLKDFQCSSTSTRRPGEHLTFVAHIQAAAESLRRPSSFIVFSGGATNPAITCSESESYEKAFIDLYEHDAAIMRGGRWACETDATDSYQNLLFSIIKFRRIVGRYPSVITVVTHAFKSRRFLELHAPAIQWPSNHIRVIGINPPFSLQELNDVERSEVKMAYALFEADMFGTRPPLSTKREQRCWDPARSKALSADLEHEVDFLLQFQGTRLDDNLSLPWRAQDLDCAELHGEARP